MTTLIAVTLSNKSKPFRETVNPLRHTLDILPDGLCQRLRNVRLRIQVENTMIDMYHIAFLWASDQKARMVNV